MKEKELSDTDKCRRIKLSKKSVEELVNIVLRKDDVERKSSKTIETFKKLQVTNDKRIETLKDIINKSEEIQNSQEKTIAALNTTIDNKNKTISSLEKTINQRNKESRILFAVVVCLIISNIILFFI